METYKFTLKFIAGLFQFIFEIIQSVLKYCMLAVLGLVILALVIGIAASAPLWAVPIIPIYYMKLKIQPKKKKASGFDWLSYAKEGLKKIREEKQTINRKVA